jgi:hypothetical protein
LIEEPKQTQSDPNLNLQTALPSASNNQKHQNPRDILSLPRNSNSKLQSPLLRDFWLCLQVFTSCNGNSWRNESMRVMTMLKIICLHTNITQPKRLVGQQLKKEWFQ